MGFVRGEYRFSSLMKQKKRGEIALSFTSPEKENCLFIIYDVIGEKKSKRFRLYYSQTPQCHYVVHP